MLPPENSASLPIDDAKDHNAGLEVGELAQLQSSRRQQALQMQSAVLDALQVSICAFDREQRYTVWNQFAAKSAEVPAEEVLGRHAREVFPELGAIGFEENFARALAGELVIVAPGRVRHPRSGKEHWIVSAYGPIYDVDGQVVGVVSMHSDKSEQMEKELALCASEANFRILVEAAPITVLVIQDGRVVYANPLAVTKLGYGSAQELLGKDLLAELVWPHERDIFRQRLLGVGEAKVKSEPREGIMLCADGSPLVLETSSTHIQFGGRSAVLALGSDVSERAKVRQIQERLVREQRAHDQTGAKLSKVTALQALTEVALRQDQEEGLLRAMVAKIRGLFGGQHAMLLMVPLTDGMPCSMIMEPALPMPIIRSLDEARLLGSVVHRSEPLYLSKCDRTRLPPPLDGPGLGTFVGVPLRMGEQNIGALAVWSSATEAYDQQYIDLLTLSAERLSTAWERIRLQADLRNSESRLRVLSQKLVGVQEAERRSLAYELHGEVGQTLTALAMLLEREVHSRPEPSSRELGDARALVTDLVARVREMSLRLRPSILDDLGLLPTLQWHCPRFSATSRIPVRLLQTDADRRFPPAIETTAYRIIQEALTNVARHAEATAATVHLWADEYTLCLQVEDNGHGFDLTTKDTSMSTGFSGMREQALQVGGTFLVDSSPGSGTCIVAELPLAPRPSLHQKRSEP